MERRGGGGNAIDHCESKGWDGEGVMERDKGLGHGEDKVEMERLQFDEAFVGGEGEERDGDAAHLE